MAINDIGNGESGLSVRDKLNTLISLYNTLGGDFTRMGWWDYADNATATTPLSVPSGNTFVYIPNDGQGSYTNTSYGLSGIPNIYDPVTGSFDFSSLAVGDTVDIRASLEVTTTTPSQSVDIELELAGGTAAQYDIQFVKNVYKTAGVQVLNRWNGIYIGNSETKTGTAKFKVSSDAAASVKVLGWYVRAITKGN